LISADTSSIVAFQNGETGRDVSAIEHALRNGMLILAPIVVTELLSFPQGGSELDYIPTLPRLELQSGYWERAGANRRLILAQGFKARTADALVAQACIDADIALIAHDTDFRHFAHYCGLKLA
jgi:predicted nucleic acid-binding protein